MKDKIKFNAKEHSYYINGEKYDSVTEIIGKYFKKFDATEIARKLAKFPVNKANKRGVRYYKKLWKAQQEYGSTVHKDIQDVLNTHDDPQCSESLHAVDWLNNYTKELNEPHIMSEVILHNKEYKIAGTADILIYIPDDNAVYVIDWKVVKEIKNKGYNDEVSKLGLPDCNFWKYALQLNMYAWMLRRNGFNTPVMKLIQLTPDGVKVFDIPGMVTEVNKILEDRNDKI